MIVCYFFDFYMLPNKLIADGTSVDSQVYHHHAHPEGWEEWKISCTPKLVLRGDVAYIHVDHEMTEDSYINAIYVKADIHGRQAQTIYFKELTPDSPKPVARFTVHEK